MKNIDSLRYNHTLSNGEDLTLAMSYSREFEDKKVFMMRCAYMYDTMQDAIHKHDLLYKMKVETQFESGKITIKDPLTRS